MTNKKSPMKPKGKLLPIFKRLLGYVFVYRRSMTLIITGFLLSAVLSLTPAFIVKQALDNYLVPDKIGSLVAAGLAIVLAALFQGLIDFATRYYSEVNGQKAVYRIRHQVYSHLMDLTFTYFDKAKTGDILSRITSDAETLQTFLGFASVTIVSNFLFIVGVFIVMFTWSFSLSILYLVFIPFILFGIYKYAFGLRPANNKLRVVLGTMNDVYQEQLHAIQLIQILGREKMSIAATEKSNGQYMNVGFQVGKIVSFWMPYVFVFIGLSTGIILWFGGFQAIAGDLSIGVLSGFITYMTMMMRPVRQTGMLTNQAITAAAAAERIFEILDLEPEVKDSPNAKTLHQVKGKVEYRDVSFSYDKKTPILQQIHFVANPGETIAIVGPTGAGKSTLMNLLPRFYDVDQGQILIDDVDIKEYTMESLRHQIGIVLQQTFLFNMSIGENIAFGRSGASLEEIREAAKLAQIDDFIMSLPNQYETLVGERGSKLSGGQQQRISIARTLLLDPPLLILDEPTASVDTVTDEKIIKAINTLREGRTVFMIAHRLWSLKSADRVLVLEKGRSVQFGTHEELIHRSGLYKDLYQIQTDSEKFRENDDKEVN